jgi:glycosyltransferase involved in cell wall biosynthesis
VAAVPLLLFGDGPTLPSGLARIARDLATRLYLEQEALGITLCQVGITEAQGWPWQGWPVYAFQETERDRGRAAVEQALADVRAVGGPQPIVWIITDPARGFDLTREQPRDLNSLESGYLDAELWGYFPIDAHNLQGTIGGPAMQCVSRMTRVLGYGKYGAGVLKASINSQMPVSYLPHGIETRVFAPTPITKADARFVDWALPKAATKDHLKIGCVATNQPRKDLGLLFTTLNELKAQGLRIACWLQTDVLTKTWDIGELARTCGLRRDEIFVSTEEISDVELAARYTWSDLTIAPGLGEGFGYPIVESLSCGTPVIHGNYAGGAAYIPDPTWLVEPVAWRLESVYALLRPVFDPKDWARAIRGLVAQQAHDPQALQAYCRGSVAHLDWQQLWPRWRHWIQKGLVDHGQR